MAKYILFAITLGVLLISYSHTAWADDGDAVGIWSFEEEAGIIVTDSGANGNNGTIVNQEYVKRVAGSVGKGLAFSGPDKKAGCVVVRKMRNYDPSKGLTIEARVRFNESFDRKNVYFIASVGKWRGPGFRFIVANNRLIFKSGDGKKLWGVSTKSEKKPLFEPNRWYHLAGTYDGAVYRVYIDGAEAANAAEERGITRGNAMLSIGSFKAGASSSVKGVLDEVRLYPKAKSPENILEAARRH